MVEIVTIKNAKIKDNGIESDIKGFGGTEDDTNIFNSPGIKALPHDNEDAVMIDVNGNNHIVATNNYNINITLDKGELIIYSSDSNGNLLSSAKCNKDGEFVINEGTDYAVAFEDLKIEFDKLKTDYNNLVTVVNGLITAYNAHTGHDSGPVPPSYPNSGSANTSDIDKAKVEKVRVP